MYHVDLHSTDAALIEAGVEYETPEGMARFVRVSPTGAALQEILEMIESKIIKPQVKRISLAINESAPFPVSYHQKDGESLVTMQQNDFEALLKVERVHRRFSYAISAASIIVCVALFFVLTDMNNVVVMQ